VAGVAQGDKLSQLIIDIAVEIAAVEIAALRRGTDPSDCVEQARNLILGAHETSYSPMRGIREDSIRAAWRVYARLQQSGVLRRDT
jgi:hypothetical protein